jgi:hypothetical protein
MNKLLSSSFALASVLLLVAPYGCGGKGSAGFSDSGDTSEAGPGLASGDDAGTVSADSGLSELNGCATATLSTARTPVILELVVDASGSMKGDKWTALVSALDGIYDQMLKEGDTSQGAGMLVFSDTKDKTIGTGPYPVSDADGVTRYNDVPIGFVDQAQHDALKKRIGPEVNASLVTPTHAALLGGFSVLESTKAAPPLPPDVKKVLVLMTDGMPTDDGNDESHPLVAKEAAIAAPVGPIQTFPVAIGDFNDIDPTWMGTLAKAGGTAPTGCKPAEASDPKKLCYFQIVPNGKTVAQLSKEFQDTVNRIRAQASSCELALPTSANADPSKVNVIQDDGAGGRTLIPEDATDGWTYDDPAHPTKVLLHGAACSTATAELQGKVLVVLGCKTVVK